MRAKEREQISVLGGHKNRGKQGTDIVTCFPKPHSPNEKRFTQSLSAIIAAVLLPTYLLAQGPRWHGCHGCNAQYCSMHRREKVVILIYHRFWKIKVIFWRELDICWIWLILATDRGTLILNLVWSKISASLLSKPCQKQGQTGKSSISNNGLLLTKNCKFLILYSNFF